MTVLELLVLSTALGMDLFSVAVPIGMNKVRLRMIFWSALVFAAFHIVMILTGYYAGHWLGGMVEEISVCHIGWHVASVQDCASIAGAMILAGLGFYMIKTNLTAVDAYMPVAHPLQGMALMVLATSVSVDALAAGLSLGMMDVDLVKLSAILGGVIFVISIVGLGLGRRLGRYIGERAELVGGSVLVVLAGHVLYTVLAG